MKNSKKPWWFTLFLIFGHIHSLIFTMASLLFCSFMIIFRQFEFYRWDEDFWTIEFYCKPGSWVQESWMDGRWAGFSMGSVLVYNYYYRDTYTTVRHERQHSCQTYMFGLMQPVMYFGICAYIFFFNKELHSYYDNPFEINARLEAGQSLINWKKVDPEDRWIFW